jgi:hypothetical protein
VVHHPHHGDSCRTGLLLFHSRRRFNVKKKQLTC